MENIEQVNAFILNLDHSIDELGPLVEKLMSKSLTERLAEVSSLDKVKLTNNYTYILSSLLFAYLKSKGVDTSKHEIMTELDKCKSYMNRLKKLEEGDSKEQEKERKEKEMVNRFMRTQLSGNSTAVTGIQEPAISRVSFEGKHTKFSDESHNSTDEEMTPVIKPSKTGKLNKVTKPDTKKSQKKKKKRVI